jgi:hypothetical protein
MRHKGALCSIPNTICLSLISNDYPAGALRSFCCHIIEFVCGQQVVDCRSSLTAIMSMNIFRLAGDMSHVFSIIVLLLRLRVAKNAQGAIFFVGAALVAFAPLIKAHTSYPIVFNVRNFCADA